MNNKSKQTQTGNITIINNDLKENFTLLSNETIRDNRLTIAEKGALIMLLSLPQNFKITTTATSQYLNISNKTFIKILDSFKKYGYLKTTRKNNNYNYELRPTSPQTSKFDFNKIETYTIEQLNYFANSQEIETKYKNLINKMLNNLTEFKKDIEKDF